MQYGDDIYSLYGIPKCFGTTECRPGTFFTVLPAPILSCQATVLHASSTAALGGVIWCQRLNRLITKRDGSFTPHSRRKISVCAIGMSEMKQAELRAYFPARQD
jgi:hypothetical protein